jgi:S1-C subfamily serine protease
MGPLTADIRRRMRIPNDTEGVLVTGIEQGSPAFRAGVQRGDVILQVNRRGVASPSEASRLLGQVADGSTAFLLILRNGQETFVTVRKR